MIEVQRERFRLAIPLGQAVGFALGWTDLGYDVPNEVSRKVVACLALDELEYSEQWRAATMLRTCLAERWPEFDCGAETR